MNELLERAIAARQPGVDYPTIIFAEHGSVVVRPSVEGHEDPWRPAQEAVVLPLLAGDDFVLSIEAVLGYNPGRRPTQDPEGQEAVLYYLFSQGELAEVQVTQIHRSDDGTVSFGEPWELFDTKAVSRGMGALLAQIERLGPVPKKPRDWILEIEVAMVLATKGHTVMWEDPTSKN